jgi:hypothetical protein
VTVDPASVSMDSSLAFLKDIFPLHRVDEIKNALVISDWNVDRAAEVLLSRGRCESTSTSGTTPREEGRAQKAVLAHSDRKVTSRI